MDKKARSVPMTEMLDRLTSFTAEGRQEVTVVYFGNDTMLNKPVEQWPLVEAMIGFFSAGPSCVRARRLTRPVVCHTCPRAGQASHSKRRKITLRCGGRWSSMIFTSRQAGTIGGGEDV